jgi:hypothetical protein
LSDVLYALFGGVLGAEAEVLYDGLQEGDSEVLFELITDYGDDSLALVADVIRSLANGLHDCDKVDDFVLLGAVTAPVFEKFSKYLPDELTFDMVVCQFMPHLREYWGNDFYLFECPGPERLNFARGAFLNFLVCDSALPRLSVFHEYYTQNLGVNYSAISDEDASWIFESGEVSFLREVIEGGNIVVDMTGIEEGEEPIRFSLLTDTGRRHVLTKFREDCINLRRSDFAHTLHWSGICLTPEHWHFVGRVAVERGYENPEDVLPAMKAINIIFGSTPCTKSVAPLILLDMEESKVLELIHMCQGLDQNQLWALSIMIEKIASGIPIDDSDLIFEQIKVAVGVSNIIGSFGVDESLIPSTRSLDPARAAANEVLSAMYGLQGKLGEGRRIRLHGLLIRNMVIRRSSPISDVSNVNLDWVGAHADDLCEIASDVMRLGALDDTSLMEGMMSGSNALLSGAL